MADSFGFIHSVIAPIFRRVEHEERPGWDRSKKRQEAKGRRPAGADSAPADQEKQREAEEVMSPTHIDLRI